MKKNIIKVIFYTFLIAAIFIDVVWFLSGLSLMGIILAITVNFSSVVLAVYLFKFRNKNAGLEPENNKAKGDIDYDKFAGFSAIALSTFFLFYSWSLLAGGELAPAENIRYRFYYDFTIFLVGCCGVYSAAIANLFFAAIFICGGFMLIRKRFK